MEDVKQQRQEEAHKRDVYNERRYKSIDPIDDMPAIKPVKSRHIERAEGRALMKQMNARMKTRVRDLAGEQLSIRANLREIRELDRRDNRMSVHDMIEHSRGADRLDRRRFK